MASRKPTTAEKRQLRFRAPALGDQLLQSVTWQIIAFGRVFGAVVTTHFDAAASQLCRTSRPLDSGTPAWPSYPDGRPECNDDRGSGRPSQGSHAKV